MPKKRKPKHWRRSSKFNRYHKLKRTIVDELTPENLPKGGKKLKFKRSKTFVKHHIKNRCNGGDNSESNLLRFESNREKAWHFLFGNMSFREVAALLIRTCKMKGQKDNKTAFYAKHYFPEDP